MFAETRGVVDAGFDTARDTIEHRLRDLAAFPVPTTLTEAMRYALLAPGKRIRPLMTLAAARFCNVDEKLVLDVACALEIVHAASLVFDDLPCMDDDAVRRDQQSTHVRFGEPVAILAGISLLTHAYAIIARAQWLDDGIKLQMIVALSETTGAQGLSLGQHIDLSLAQPSAQSVTQTHQLKTGVLFDLAAHMACLAGGCDTQTQQDLAAFTHNVGLAFQLLDDLDDADDKTETNLVAVIGTTGSADRVQNYLKQARFAIAGYDRGHFLDAFITEFFPA